MKIKVALVSATFLGSCCFGTPTAALAGHGAVNTAGTLEGVIPDDRSMTCAMIASERAGLQTAIATRAAKAQRMAKTKKSLFGFARTMASVMVPGAAQVMGSGSVLGSLAAQGIGQSASQAIATMNTAQAVANPAQSIDPEQSRLDHLAAISADRQCAA